MVAAPRDQSRQTPGGPVSEGGNARGVRAAHAGSVRELQLRLDAMEGYHNGRYGSLPRPQARPSFLSFDVFLGAASGLADRKAERMSNAARLKTETTSSNPSIAGALQMVAHAASSRVRPGFGQDKDPQPPRTSSEYQRVWFDPVERASPINRHQIALSHPRQPSAMASIDSGWVCWRSIEQSRKPAPA